MAELTGKTCLVTGGTGGIGQATVELLSARGARVVFQYHSDERAAEQLTGCLGTERVLAVRADLKDPGAAVDVWRAALSFSDRIDVLVNNAGVMLSADLADPLEKWHRVWEETLRVNLIAAADLTREALMHFRDRGAGIIVNVASRAAFRGDTLEYLAYAASKAGLVALTRSVARGAARDGILAYTLAPGFVDTPMVAPFLDEYGLDAIVRDIPIGAMAPASEVAAVIAFFASGAARHATGATIDINGASYVR